MKIYNFEQGTPEWFDVRKMKMTASNATAIGNNGSGLETYIMEIMSEMYSSAESESYSGKDTERGKELEPIARDLYELETGNKVEQVGFVELDDYIGCSPDGFIGEDGLVEFKALKDSVYFNFLVNGVKTGISSYVWQVQMQQWVTNRKWCDLVFFNPNYKKSMIITRIVRDEVAIEKLKIGAGAGKKMIIQIKNRLGL